MTKKRQSGKARGSARPTRRSRRAVPPSGRAALSVATSARRSIGERVAALTQGPLAATEQESDLQKVIAILRNGDEPIPVRLAALQMLQAASFGAPAFEPLRGVYMTALRQVAQDPDAELRQRAFGLLARARDGFAQRRLLEGLRDPQKALVPPEKALQLLAYDIHAEAYPIAREIVSKPPSAVAKREALRLLAADAATAPVFEQILRDKSEAPELRQTAAGALRALQPDRLQAYAREALLDPLENEELQATSLTALTQFGDEASVTGDTSLLTRARRLSTEASDAVKESALQFLDRYDR